MTFEAKLLTALASCLKVNKEAITVKPLQVNAMVEDATQKYLVFTQTQQAKAFVLVSSLKTPQSVKSGDEKMRAVAEKIGIALTKNLLMPLEVGEIDGLTYSISRYHKPLHKNRLLHRLDAWRLRASLIQWVIDVAKISQTRANTTEQHENFILDLQVLAVLPALKQEIKTTALEAIKAMNEGRWQPMFVCAHNDLWLGNVLNGDESTFVIIDWDGALVKGYAFYDLVRLAQALKLNKHMLRPAVAAYCEVMQCNLVQAKYYLISAFAFTYRDLGGWQHERFMFLLEGCMKTLEECS